jgi:hypothetical protein
MNFAYSRILITCSASRGDGRETPEIKHISQIRDTTTVSILVAVEHFSSYTTLKADKGHIDRKGSTVVTKRYETQTLSLLKSKSEEEEVERMPRARL